MNNLFPLLTSPQRQMQLLELSVLLCVIGLMATFLVTQKRRWRRWIYIALCLLGVTIAIFGWGRFYGTIKLEENRAITKAIDQALAEGRVAASSRLEIGEVHASYFKALGLVLSVLLVATLSFCILEIDRTFTKKQRQSWLYPILAWYFAAWAAVDMSLALWTSSGFGLWYNERLIPIPDHPSLMLRIEGFRDAQGAVAIWSVLLTALLFIAFVISGFYHFSLRFFRPLFPLVSVAAGFKLALMLTSVPRHGISAALLGQTWMYFMLLAYFYINVKYHEDRLKHPILKRLPSAAVVIVVMSLLREFPEIDILRRTLPVVTSVMENTLLAVDLLFICAIALLTATGSLFAAGSAQASPSGSPTPRGGRLKR